MASTSTSNASKNANNFSSASPPARVDGPNNDSGSKETLPGFATTSAPRSRTGTVASHGSMLLCEMKATGRASRADWNWVLGGILRVLEPLAIACWADANLGGEYRLGDDARGAIPRMLTESFDQFYLAQDELGDHTTPAVRARVSLVCDLGECITDGHGMLEISLRSRLRATA